MLSSFLMQVSKHDTQKVMQLYSAEQTFTVDSAHKAQLWGSSFESGYSRLKAHFDHCLDSSQLITGKSNLLSTYNVLVYSRSSADDILHLGRFMVTSYLPRIL